MNKYQQYMGQLSEMIFLLLLMLLPYPRYVFQPVWIAWLIVWGLEGHWLQPRQWQWKRALPGCMFLVWIIWELISLLWAQDVDTGWRELGRHINLLSLAVIPMMGVAQNYSAKRAEYALILGAVISIPVYLFVQKNAFLYVVEWTGNPDVGPWLSTEGRQLLMFFQNRCYFCMVQLATICCLFHRRKDILNDFGTFRGYLLMVVTLGIILTGIFLTMVRTAWIVLLILATFFLLQKTKKIWVKTVVLAGILAIGTGFTLFHPRMQQLLQSETYTQLEKEANDPTFQNARIAIWYTALQHPSDYSLRGLGANNSTPYLVEQYKNAGWTFFAEKGYGAHNQYLAVWMELGLLAMLLFTIGWWTLPLFYHQERTLAWAFTLFLGINMLTDALFGCISGVVIICALFLILYLGEYE